MTALRLSIFGLALALCLPVRAAPAPKSSPLQSSQASQSFDREHAAWTLLLKKYVHWNVGGAASSVDYDGFAHDRSAVDAYLATLGRVTPSQFQAWSTADRKAFLINAYNAATVELILTKYPDLKSINDLGGWLSTPWKRRFVVLLGKTRSLDDIEQGMLRKAPEYRDPRVHFAVNCASLGCPALRDEAYVGARLDAQLTDQTRRFLRDSTRNRFIAASRQLKVSKILDWYGADFAKVGGVATFLAGYADALGMTPAEAVALHAGRIGIDYLPYDWSLNGWRP
ncbi:DUF547 domain-containing protein [soil metagenome]